MFLREQVEKFRASCSVLEGEGSSEKRERERVQAERDRLEEEIERVSGELAGKVQQVKKLKEELDCYKRNNYQSVKAFCGYVANRDSIGTNNGGMNPINNNIFFSNTASILDTSNFSSALIPQQDVFSLHE